MKYFVIIILAVVGLAIGTSLFVIGSPNKARLRRFDEIRVQNLQYIQDNIFSYWQDKKTVPDQLAQLNDDIRAVRVPMDPSTGGAYSYEKLSTEKFRLCADFALSTMPESKGNTTRPMFPSYAYGPYMGEQTWDHGAGTVCFERTIDKERYQKEQVPPKPVY